MSGEFEIELDDDVAEMIQQAAEKEGRTFEEQAGIMIREALAEVVANKATSGEPTPPPGESPTTS